MNGPDYDPDDPEFGELLRKWIAGEWVRGMTVYQGEPVIRKHAS